MPELQLSRVHHHQLHASRLAAAKAPNVHASGVFMHLQMSGEFAPHKSLLELFCYGNWSDYQGAGGGNQCQCAKPSTSSWREQDSGNWHDKPQALLSLIIAAAPLKGTDSASMPCPCSLSPPRPAAHKAQLPPLTQQHELKLKQLTVSSLALQQKVGRPCLARAAACSTQGAAWLAVLLLV